MGCRRGLVEGPKGEGLGQEPGGWGTRQGRQSGLREAKSGGRQGGQHGLVHGRAPRRGVPRLRRAAARPSRSRRLLPHLHQPAAALVLLRVVQQPALAFQRTERCGGGGGGAAGGERGGRMCVRWSLLRRAGGWPEAWRVCAPQTPTPPRGRLTLRVPCLPQVLLHQQKRAAIRVAVGRAAREAHGRCAGWWKVLHVHVVALLQQPSSILRCQVCRRC